MKELQKKINNWNTYSEAKEDKMEEDYKVSVVLPTYKRENFFFERAISSLINQSYENIEIIIVDDNSHGSIYSNQIISFIEKVKKNKNFKKNIVYIKTPKNLGGALSRNLGIESSSGYFVSFLDDDDKYLENKIKDQVSFMIKNSLDVSFTNLLIYNENEKLVDYRFYKNVESYSKSELIKYHLLDHLTGTPTFMYKASSLKKINGFKNVKMGQEFILMLDSIENDLVVGWGNQDNVIAYRHSNGGISSGENKIAGEKKLYAIKEKYFDLLSKSEINYIKMRHHLVLSFANLREKNYLDALKHGIVSFIFSPVSFLKKAIFYLKL